MEFYLAKNKDLTVEYLQVACSEFQTNNLPKLRRWGNYYAGKQAIMFKQATDAGKPCNKVVVNFCSNIADNYQGYIVGKPVTYVSDDERFAEVQNVLNYNDVTQEDILLLKDALIYGVAYEINYIDEEGQQRFRRFDPKECFPIYDDTIGKELMYVVRMYKTDLIESNVDKYTVEVYGKNTVRTYKSESGFSSFNFISEVPHYYGQVPITVFQLNEDERSIFDSVISLQDSYNKLLSGEIDDFEAFADAYLVLKGITADEEELSDMKEHRVLMMDADCSVDYLTKNINDTAIKDMLVNVKENIHKISASPDFTDATFFNQSGIAIRYRLQAFENKAGAIESYMKKALQRRIELICTILNITNIDGASVWRDIDIVFNRNLPIDLNESVTLVNQLRGVVSTQTLLSLLPFIKDPSAEYERVQEEANAANELYLSNFAYATNVDSRGAEDEARG